MDTSIKQSADIIQDTKKHIINTARLFFSEYSYLGVSMSDIAKKLNITKAALYYHFAGKTEIYQKVLDEVFHDLKQFIAEASNEPTVNKKLSKLIKNYLDFGFREKNIIKALVLKVSPMDNKIVKHITVLRDQVADQVQSIVAEALANKNLNKKVDSRLLTSMLAGMMDGLLLEQTFLNKKIDSAKISDQIIAVLF